MTEGIQKPTCSNCTVREKTGFCFEEGTACINHPNAREYLMADVITELDTLQTYPVNMKAAVYLSDVIALIRDGVKHE